MTIQRYRSIDTKELTPQSLRQSGTNVYRSLLPVKVEEASDDILYVADSAERLDYLAFRFYGNSSLWHVLASVNNLTNGSLHIPPGMIIRIPAKSRII